MTQLKKRMVQLEVLRYDPEKDSEPHFQNYEVECNEEWVVLDALRRKRNANDYTGDVVTSDMVTECVAQATQLRAMLRKHLKTNHAELLKTKK